MTASYQRLTRAEREEISLGLVQGQSLRTLARALNRSPSTLSREITRNRSPVGYRAVPAQCKAATRYFQSLASWHYPLGSGSMYSRP
jgi:IS30 family transposase